MRGLGVLGTETLDPGAFAGDFLLGARNGRFLALADRRFVDDEGGIAAGVQGDGAVVDIQGVAGHVVEEALVVRNDDRAAGVAG